MKVSKSNLFFKSLFFFYCLLINLEVKATSCQSEGCGQVCGNGRCESNSGENTQTCPADCRAPRCGDNDCQQYAGENHSNCPQDCAASARCGDGVISNGENCSNCPTDVPICSTGCGDNICSSSLGETCLTCSGDCGSCGSCGNGICDCAPNGTETFANCPQDCRPPVTTTTTTTCPTTTTTTVRVLVCGDDVCSFNSGECGVCPECSGVAACGGTTTTTTTCPTTTTTTTCPTTTTTTTSTTTTSTTVPVCDNDGLCEANKGETAQNCVNDCRCPTGQILINGQCTTTTVCKFEVRGRSGRDFVHDPNFTSSTPACLRNLIADGLTQCRTIWTGGHAKYADNCVASLLVEGRYRTIADGRYRIDAGEDVTLYFDGACNRVNRPAAGSPSCNAGHYRFGASPIALLWDRSFGVEDLSEDVRLVTFPIDPSQPNKLVEWKASAKAPLLVYDPTGEGKITSGYQLFGNWTFGPKKVASLKDSAESAKLWNNGFDALATLDTNADSEISGAELKSLSLWFDDNRNAVSEKGEVRRITSMGVKKLFYQGYANNDLANAIVLNIGFERERAGKTEQGIMADWFTDTVASELEYAQKAMITSAFSRTDQLQSSAIANLNKISSNDPKITKDTFKDESEFLAYKKGAALVSGSWDWDSESNKIPVSGGSFIITDNDDGTISGLTTIELAMESSFGAESAGLVSGFKGKAKLEDDGSVTVVFELKKEDGTTILQSAAKLNKEGTSMDGSSSGKIKTAAANTDISYTWVATKLK